MNNNRFTLSQATTTVKNIASIDTKVLFAMVLLAFACGMVIMAMVTAMTRGTANGHIQSAGLLTSNVPVVVTR